MLVIIIVLFTMCWGPTLIDNVLAAFGVVTRLNYEHLKYMRQAFALMSYFNSCVNPVVYAFMSKHWRQSFRYALCMCSDPARRRYNYNHHQMSPIANTSVINYPYKPNLKVTNGILKNKKIQKHKVASNDIYGNYDNHQMAVTTTMSDLSPNESDCHPGLSAV